MSLSERSSNLSDKSSSENCPRKPPTSESKIEANRRNALLSTGPKTTRGKRTVARNAIKHGLLAREVVITAGDGAEDPHEFECLIEGLRKHYEPIGQVEVLLIQEVAVCWWRKARILRTETGDIRKRLDTHRLDSELQKSDKVNSALVRMEKKALRERWSEAGIMLNVEDMHCTQSLRDHRIGLARMETILEEAEFDIMSSGRLSPLTQSRMWMAFGFWDLDVAIECLVADPPTNKTQGQQSDSTEEKRANQHRLRFFREVRDKLQVQINRLKEHAERREELEEDAERRSFSLPSAEDADRVLRYEAHLDRKLYRAMDELERIQRRRKGENVPPPLNVNMGRKE